MKNRIEKPWGYEVLWAQAPGRYVGKILHIESGQALSLQYHEVKDETIYVQSGEVLLELEGEGGQLEELVLSEGEGRRILPGRKHRMTARRESEVLEVSTDHLEDVVRLEDRYGRVETSS